MKVIQQRLVLLIVLTSMVLLASLILFIRCFASLIIDVRFVFALLLLIFIILVSSLMRQYKAYSAANLIIENSIMNIQAVKIEQNTLEAGTDILPIDTIEFIISCFGILVGSKVIKFNVDGISLKEIEIGHDSICIAYGKNERKKIIRLMHRSLEKQKLLDVAERFRYETGIIPKVID